MAAYWLYRVDQRRYLLAFYGEPSVRRIIFYIMVKLHEFVLQNPFKFWFNAQFMNGLDQHTQIMAEHLAQHFVELPDIALAPYRIAKLRLDHAEGRLNIGPLVVMGSKLLSIIHEVVIHFRPDRVVFGDCCIDLERNKRCSIGLRYSGKVGIAEIRLVSGDFLHLEILGGALQEWYKVGCIICSPTRDIN